ncbi:hypothetical protein IAU60_004489 [Kwoniella sp. DSM 27419]
MTTTSTHIHLHTLDLRIHDSPSLHMAHQPNSTSTHFLPLYIFDPRQLDLSGLPDGPQPSPARADGPTSQQDAKAKHGPKHTRCAPLSRYGGFHRTSPYRLRFLLEAVYELRESYQRSGGDMLIGYGRPERLLPQLVKRLKQDGGVDAVHVQREYSVEEVGNYRRLARALEQESVELKMVDSKTLLPSEHLPFQAKTETPDVYTEFRKIVEGMGLGLEEGGMLVPPLRTAKRNNDGMRVSIGDQGTELKPCPKVDLAALQGDVKEGGWVQKQGEQDTIQGMYSALVKPLIASPPLAGWSSATSQDDKLAPLHSDSAVPFAGHELAAMDRLDDYIGLPGKGNDWQGGYKAKHYKETRNGLRGEGFSTKFSAWLSLGSLSPKEAGWRVGQMLDALGRDKEIYKNVYWIIFELLWRDYFQFIVYRYSLQNEDAKADPYHPNSTLFNPDGFSSQISTYPKDLRPKVDEWHAPNLAKADDVARKWCEGMTGVPFIDANMRELKETGWMSNRGRQNVASFLTKDLYADWRIGAEFFEMHLVDYDTCSNWGNWQYQAGVGNDPRSSRQFNPIKQANDYDPDNEYVKLWIPELRNVQDEYVQTPWLINDKSKLGNYPSKPIVELQSWKKHYPGQKSQRNRGKGGGGGGGKAKGGGNGQAKGKGKGPKSQRAE